MKYQKHSSCLPRTILFLLFLYSNAISSVVQLQYHKQAAQQIAQNLWQSANLSEPIPYYDLNNNVHVYIYNICRSGPFDTMQVENRESKTGNKNYSFMCISARTDEEPLLEYADRLSDDFIIKNKLDNLAAQDLGANAVLLRHYYIDAGSKWILYTNRIDSVYIKMLPPYTRFSPNEFEINVADEWHNFIKAIKYKYPSLYEQEKIKNQESWSKLERGTNSINTETSKKIDCWEEMPYYDWHKGCTPTSTAMCLGYFDNVGLYPYHNYFGNLVSYCFSEWDPIENETDYNVPDILNTLAKYMKTNSKTGKTYLWNVSDAIIRLVKEKGYDCDASWHGVGSSDATAQNDIIRSIDNNRPCLVNSHNHSYAAYGYRYKENEDKLWVDVHDTWDNIIPHKLYVKWFYSANCMNPKTPGIGTIKLTSPIGSQEYNLPSNNCFIYTNQICEITWNTNAEKSGYGKVNIYHMWLDTLSNSFQTSLIANTSNDGYYEWFVPLDIPHSPDHRIHIEWTDEDGNIFSSDGSFGPFYIYDRYFMNSIIGIPYHTSERDFQHLLADNKPWGVVGIRTAKDKDHYELKMYNDTDMSFLEKKDIIPAIIDASGENRVGFIVYSPGNISGLPKISGVHIYTTSKNKVWVQGSSSLQNLSLGVNHITWGTNDVVHIYGLPLLLSNFSSNDTIQILINTNKYIDLGLALYSHFTTYKYDNRDTPKTLSLFADDSSFGENEVLNLIVNKNVLPLDDILGLVVFCKTDSVPTCDIEIDIMPLNQSTYSSTAELNQDSTIFAIDGTKITLNKFLSINKLFAATINLNKSSNWTALALSNHASEFKNLNDTLSVVNCIYPFLNFLIFNLNGIDKTNLPYIKLNRNSGSGGSITGIGIESQSLHVGDSEQFSLTPQRRLKMWRLEIPAEYQTKTNLNIDIKLNKISNTDIQIGVLPLDQESGLHCMSKEDLADVEISDNSYHYEGPSKELLIIAWLDKPVSTKFSMSINISEKTHVNSNMQLISDFALFNAYPNPFNSSTVISYQLAKPCYVDIRIFDINGRDVKTLSHNKQPAGNYKIPWDGTNSDNEPMPSSIYFIKLKAENYTAIKKVTLIR